MNKKLFLPFQVLLRINNSIHLNRAFKELFSSYKSDRHAAFPNLIHLHPLRIGMLDPAEMP